MKRRLLFMLPISFLIVQRSFIALSEEVHWRKRTLLPTLQRYRCSANARREGTPSLKENAMFRHFLKRILFTIGAIFIPMSILLLLTTSASAQAVRVQAACPPTATFANKNSWQDLLQGLTLTGGSDKVITFDPCTFATLQTSSEVPPNLHVDDQVHSLFVDVPSTIRTILVNHLSDLLNTSCPGGAIPHLTIPYQGWLEGSGYYFGSSWNASILSQHTIVSCAS
jgi:hypothetical protein